jgi:hypothetical protein
MSSASAAPLVIHRGGCHCGRVRFEVQAPAAIDVVDCNCSMCARLGGYLHLIVARDRFRLVAGEDALTTYTFNTGVARHRFCSVCGIKSFYVPRSHPHAVSVSARCLDPGTVTEMRISAFDGRNWEESAATLPAVD